MSYLLFDSQEEELVNELVTAANTATGRQWLLALGIFLIMLAASHLFMRFFTKRLNASTRISRSLHSVLVTLVRFCLVLLSILVAANAVGASLSSLLLILGLFGAGLTLAVQGILSNIAGCLILLSGHMFEVDDYIETASGSGTVQEINLMNTKLLSYDGNTIFIPNSILYSQAVTNLTAFGRRRLALSLRVSAAHAPQQVREAVMAALTHAPAILPDPAPALNVTGYAPGHVNYTLLLWTKKDDYWPTRHLVMEQIYVSLKERGIEMTDRSVSVLLSDT